MIVVSNTSPISNLFTIGKSDLMQKLYGRLLIPEAVRNELQFQDADLSWVDCEPITDRSLAEMLTLELDIGEAEAIVLAKERGADLLLMDERIGRRVAARLGLRVIGVLGILVEAKSKGLISEVKPILDDLLTRAGFWINPRLYARFLLEVGES